ncbi:hypothetical protein ACM0IS_02125 [Mycoplasma aquilae ATCC BAA-1896]
MKELSQILVISAESMVKQLNDAMKKSKVFYLRRKKFKSRQQY